MTDLEREKHWEEQILRIIEPWPKGQKAKAYRYLFNLGFRVHDVDRMVRESLKEEAEKEKARESFP